MRRWPMRLGAVVIGSSLALAAAGARASEGPKPVPRRYRDSPLEVKLGRLEKGSTRLSDLRGQPVLLKLWATWCEPCRDQDAILESMKGELARRHVRVVAVDEGENAAKVRAFLAKTPSPFVVLLDPHQTVPRLLGAEAIPYLAALRSDGTVAALYEGLLRRDGILRMLDQAAPLERTTETPQH